mmetsp:Transcript_14784/g.47238  ORF Transcript_14784/g.47238 Transcript_14784/m.47238 type:complete len:217 (+) Transcript_14784:601-1251(+)
MPAAAGGRAPMLPRVGCSSGGCGAGWLAPWPPCSWSGSGSGRPPDAAPTASRWRGPCSRGSGAARRAALRQRHWAPGGGCAMPQRRAGGSPGTRGGFRRPWARWRSGATPSSASLPPGAAPQILLPRSASSGARACRRRLWQRSCSVAFGAAAQQDSQRWCSRSGSGGWPRGARTRPWSWRSASGTAAAARGFWPLHCVSGGGAQAADALRQQSSS